MWSVTRSVWGWMDVVSECGMIFLRSDIMCRPATPDG